MDEIAAKVGVSKTSVHNIIERKNTLAFKLALYHKIAVDLTKKGHCIFIPLPVSFVHASS